MESVSQLINVTINSLDDAPAGSVMVSGLAQQGQTLTADTSTLSDADGLGTLSYQWKADGTDINGATSSSYTLRQEDVSKIVTVVINYTDNEGTPESILSLGTNSVTFVVNGHTIEPNANLEGANLSGANLENAKLSGADLTGANLSNTQLNGANLTNADLKSANLSGAYLGNVNLSGANLNGTNLSGAKVNLEDWDLLSLEQQEVAILIVSSTLTATVITRDGTAMDGVTVTASDSSYTTDGAGQTSFEVSNGSDVVVNASLDFENVSPTNAINAMDALQALRIAVGLETSNGPATYEDYIASDFDASGSVNAMDALGILKYAVGLDAPDARWVFIDSDGDYSDVTQSSVTYDTGISLEAFAADASVSLTGILVGDIDDSYSGLIA